MPVAGFVAVLPALLAFGAAESSQVAAAAQLEFDRRAEANGWLRAGEVSTSKDIELSFWLKQTNLDKLKRIADSVSNPSSPDYGHYLSREEVDALTAPAAHDETVVRQALLPYEGKKDGDGAVISAVVPVGFAAHLLGGAFMRYCRRGAAEACLVRNPTAQVPRALAAACDIISPLDDPLPQPLPGPIVGGAAGGHGQLRVVSLAEVAATGPTGCCFQIGFGAMMRPCCLRVQPNLSEEDCHVPRRLAGGGVGFHKGDSCPASAEEAKQWMEENGAEETAGAAESGDGETSPTRFREEVVAVAQPKAEAATTGRTGCCFQIGFGDMMRPCCLRVQPNTPEQDCHVPRGLVGGGGGFRQGDSCPADAEEAERWMEENSAGDTARAVPRGAGEVLPARSGGDEVFAARPEVDKQKWYSSLAVCLCVLALVGVALCVVLGRQQQSGTPLLQEEDWE